jgi:hypothetical protein
MYSGTTSLLPVDRAILLPNRARAKRAGRASAGGLGDDRQVDRAKRLALAHCKRLAGTQNPAGAGPLWTSDSVLSRYLMKIPCATV